MAKNPKSPSGQDAREETGGQAGHYLSDQQRIDWLRLTRTEGIGPRTFRTLVNRFGGASAALDALPELLHAQGRKAHIVSRDDAEAEMDVARRYGVRFIAMGEPDFPRLLAATDSCPPLIGLRGDTKLFSRPCVGIVGSRNASAAGLKIAELFSTTLARNHCVIISGLARGIDATAHRCSLQTGTIAVLAGGHDRVYPPEHRDLLDSIIETGAAISEMPMGWEPRGRDFPRRNRIISGLSHGVLLVEAALRSGSLITARFAAEQGRDVFAVPGSPLDPRAEGTNDLIRNGATLVSSPEHVLEALAPIFGRKDWPPEAHELAADKAEPLWDELEFFAESASQFTLDDPPEERATQSLGATTSIELAEQQKAILLALIGPSPVALDDVIRLAGQPTPVIQALLLELELEGKLIRHGAGLVSAAP